MKKVILSMLCLLICAAASAKDIKTLVVTTNPQMHCQGCETKIKNGLKFEKGVKSIETSVDDQRVTITYDADKTSAENLQKAFSKIGYTATDVNAAPAKKAGCCGNCANCPKKQQKAQENKK